MRCASFLIADLSNLLLGAFYESDDIDPKMRICTEDILLIQDNSKLSHLMTSYLWAHAKFNYRFAFCWIDRFDSSSSKNMTFFEVQIKS